MSYLAFDLDALKRVPDAARSAGIPEAEFGYGLIRLWQWCWAEKTDKVEPTHIRGFFGGDTTRVAEALCAFRFLDIDQERWFRVRGAERYLGLQLGRSKGGKKAAGNLLRGTKKKPKTDEIQPEASRRGVPEGQPGVSRESAGEEPGESPGCVPALTPSTQHPTPNIKEAAAAAEAQAGPVAVVYTRPTGSPETWTGEEFFCWAQFKRQEAGLIGERQRPGDLSAWFSTAMMTLGGNVEALQDAFINFGSDRYWQTQRPQLPFRGFAKQWDKYLPRGAVHAHQ